MLDAHCGPLQWNLAYLVKIVTLTTPTHVANIVNEWLPIQTYGDAYFAISLIRKCQSKFHNVKLLDTVYRTYSNTTYAN